MQEIKRPARRLIILWLAERMPLILQPEPLDAWLDPDISTTTRRCRP